MRRIVPLALAAIAVALPLSAQSNPCRDKGPRLPAAGGWAEYQSDSGDMKMTYIGRDSAGERIELAMTRMGRGGRPMNMVVQVVVPSFPYEMGQATEMVMQMGDQPPMRMGGEMMAMMRSRMPRSEQLSPEACARLTRVGVESVEVPAGTFRATHWRDEQSGTDVWVEAGVPFGMVKVINGGRTMVLKGRGTDGVTGLTGTPQDMGAGMMGPPGGRRPRN